MKSSLLIIVGLRQAVVAGYISAGTAEGIIQFLVAEMVNNNQ